MINSFKPLFVFCLFAAMSSAVQAQGSYNDTLNDFQQAYVKNMV